MTGLYSATWTSRLVVEKIVEYIITSDSLSHNSPTVHVSSEKRLLVISVSSGVAVVRALGGGYVSHPHSQAVDNVPGIELLNENYED